MNMSKEKKKKHAIDLSTFLPNIFCHFLFVLVSDLKRYAFQLELNLQSLFELQKTIELCPSKS